MKREVTVSALTNENGAITEAVEQTLSEPRSWPIPAPLVPRLREALVFANGAGFVLQAAQVAAQQAFDRYNELAALARESAGADETAALDLGAGSFRERRETPS